MKKNLLLYLLMIMFPVVAFGQNWQDMGGFPDDTTWVDAMHGVAVDAENKVWVQPWAATAWIDPVTGDSVRDASGNAVFTRTLYVYNPDGTLAMDPIRTITIDTVTDTLAGNLRGLRSDHNGDILVVSGAGEMYRLNHQTGEGMDKVQVAEGSLSAPGVDANGNIYTAMVVPSNPIKIYDADFNFLSNAVDSADGFSRSFEVSADGNTIYWAGYSNGAIFRFSRSDEFSPFEQEPDTLLQGIVSEAIVRNPATGNIWFSNAPAAGTSPSGDFGAPEQMLTWYEYDPATETLVDSLKYGVANPIGDEKARGIAFSPDGNTAYAVIWDTNGNTSVKKFVNSGATSVEQIDSAIPKNFTLSQNYPNPFNPSTTIDFTLEQTGHASLVVYDVLGRKVASLVEGILAAGSYSATFDAQNLPSGTYLYQLEFEGQRITNKMLLLK